MALPKVENLSFLPLTAERHHNAPNFGNKPTSRTLSFDYDTTLKILKTVDTLRSNLHYFPTFESK